MEQKKYNYNKFCFIICTNDIQQLNECMLYLQMLDIPEGYETEVLTIQEATGMCAGYNEGMNASDAKYKIYIHQDTFIVNRFFLHDILRVFHSDDKIGMLGMIGAEELSKDGVMWHEKRCGNFYQLDELIRDGYDGVEMLLHGNREVEVVDGFLIATQYDIPWREDILKGWDFYDVSQCLEFRRVGYKIMVPQQKENWVIHACGIPALWNYNENREIVIKEYPEIYENKKGQLRILFVHTTLISLSGLPLALCSMGHTVIEPKYKMSTSAAKPEEMTLLEDSLQEGNYDLVMTYDLCPGVAEMCNKYHVKYYAWCFDSPLLELYRKEACYDQVYVSVFDRKQYERLQKTTQIKNLMHVPLATEVDAFGDVVIHDDDFKKYGADISFVGRLYDNRGYEELFGEEDYLLKQEADSIVNSGKCIWDTNAVSPIFERASEELVHHMSRELADYNGKYHIDDRYYAESMKLVRRCNEIERTHLLNTLAEKHNVVLYSDKSSFEGLSNRIDIRGWVNYWEGMPKVFYCSKINLNITSRSVESGIAQRVWDILAVGGFCLTNWQPELEEYLVPGKDLDVYHNLDELVEKVDYYLKHEEARKRIGINGYQKVRKYHTYEKRLKSVFDQILN